MGGKPGEPLRRLSGQSGSTESLGEGCLSKKPYGEPFLCVCVLILVGSDSATLGTVTCQAPWSTGILQAGILEWVATPSSRGSSQPRDRTQVSCIAGEFFTS